MFSSLSSTEQNLRSEEVHLTEQLQDVEEDKDDSNEEENKDSLVDDEDEKEDLGYEEEAEEEEEDGPAAGGDEEKSDARDPEPPREACNHKFQMRWICAGYTCGFVHVCVCF